MHAMEFWLSAKEAIAVLHMTNLNAAAAMRSEDSESISQGTCL